MAEYTPVSMGTNVQYAGYFDFARLWKLVREYMQARGYTYVEEEHNELVRKEGKDIHLVVDVDRYLSDYVIGRITITATAKGLTDVEVERDGKKYVLNDGTISLSFEASIVTDYEGRFASKGSMFFLRVLMERFIFQRQLDKFKYLVQADLDGLIKEIKAYLNLFSY